MTIAAHYRGRRLAERALSWWLGELAGLGRDAANALGLGGRGAVTIVAGERYWIVRHQRRPLGQVDWAVDDGVRSLAALVPEAARRRPVAVEIPPERTLSRVVHFPAGARGELDRIVEFEIARHFPFPASRVFFRHRIVGRAGAGSLAVEIVAVPRDIVAAIRADLAAAGLRVGAVAVAAQGDGERLLLPREALGGAGAGFALRPALALAALALAALVSWPLAQHVRLAALDRDIAALKPQAEAALRAHSRLRRDSERLAAVIRLRAARPPLIAVLDRLSRAVPDGSWLQSLSLAGRELVIDGLSPSAATIVLALEHSGGFSDIVFRAPIAREASGLEHFQLGATIREGGR
jgi:general secretion pathway protein L